MKTHLYKFSAMAVAIICYASSSYAQGYVDDLYYNKNNESHQTQERSNRNSKNYNSATSSNKPSSNQPWKQTLANDGMNGGTTAQASSSEEYYPGMFAEAVGKNNASQEYKNYNHESDYQPSWYGDNTYVILSPSWSIGFGFGFGPYYTNPWMASPYYGGYWGNPWYVGYPYYGGWYNSWYGWGWNYPGYGWGYPHYGGYYPPYGGGYYPPRYTRSNSVYTGHVRGGSSSYRPSGTRPSNSYTRGGTGQYRPSTTYNRSTTGQYRPTGTTTYPTRGTSTGTVTRPTNTTNSQYNRQTNTNSQYNRQSNTQYNRSTNNSTTTRSTGTSNATYNRSTGGGTGGGGATRTYNRR